MRRSVSPANGPVGRESPLLETRGRKRRVAVTEHKILLVRGSAAAATRGSTPAWAMPARTARSAVLDSASAPDRRNRPIYCGLLAPAYVSARGGSRAVPSIERRTEPPHVREVEEAVDPPQQIIVASAGPAGALIAQIALAYSGSPMISLRAASRSERRLATAAIAAFVPSMMAPSPSRSPSGYIISR